MLGRLTRTLQAAGAGAAAVVLALVLARDPQLHTGLVDATGAVRCAQRKAGAAGLAGQPRHASVHWC